MSDTPQFDPSTTATAEAPSQPIPPAVQAALDAAIARIEELEKSVGKISQIVTTPQAVPTTDPPPASPS